MPFLEGGLTYNEDQEHHETCQKLILEFNVSGNFL
jgi:hypothetical protein